MGQTKKIFTIGGGSGQFTLLSGLRELDHINITSVVSMFDSGGSTGRLRRQLGVLPPGDAVKCVLALSPFGEIAAKILLKPAPKGTGVRAGGSVRTILELAGISNIVGKILGTNNKINNATATIEALKDLRTIKPPKIKKNKE